MNTERSKSKSKNENLMKSKLVKNTHEFVKDIDYE